MRKCCTCKAEKPLEEFSPTSKRCKECWRIYMRGKLQRIRLELAGELPEKTCWRCHRTLSIENFAWYEHGKGRLQECRDCHEPDGPKRCPRCGEIKPRSEFHRKADGRSSYCKPCNKESCRERARLRQYGLAPEEYEAAVAGQNGCCAICGKPETRRDKHGELCWLSVDHHHGTKQVRDLLCRNCNLVVGYANEDPATLDKAAAYLRLHAAHDNSLIDGPDGFVTKPDGSIGLNPETHWSPWKQRYVALPLQPPDDAISD